MRRLLPQASRCDCERTLLGLHGPRLKALDRRRRRSVLPFLRTASSTPSDWVVDPIQGLVSRRNPSTATKQDDLYQVIVGLEIHAQLDIPTKLFSPAPSATQRKSQTTAPNTLLHPFDLAVPGFLPTLSKSAVQKAVLAAAALNCEVSHTSRFERKHYAYADLPHSYQITQQRWPLATNGSITCSSPLTTNSNKVTAKSSKRSSSSTPELSCRIERIQLECDTAKTITTKLDPTTRNSQQSSSSTSTSTSPASWSLIDFTRAGTALIEIVTHPDLRSAQQAAAVVTHLRQLLQHANVCPGKMQEGHLRVDVNVNLQRFCYSDGDDDNSDSDQQQQPQRSPRVEVKNLNSIQQVTQAIDYEAKRQAHEWSRHLLDSDSNDNNKLYGETRTWDVLKGQTKLIRRKDAADDYRFLPEPDLPPLVLNEAAFDGVSLQEFIRQHLPELPSVAVQRLSNDYGISDYQARVVCSDPPAIRFLDDAMTLAPQKNDKEFAKTVCNLLCNELFALIKEKVSHELGSGGEEEDDDEVTVAQSTVSAQQLVELARMQGDGEISSTMAKKILSILFEAANPDASPRQIAADNGFELISDPDRLLSLCHQVIAEHPNELAVYRKGGKFVTKMQKLFTGKAMAACRGNAHPERLQEAVEQALMEME